MAYPLCAGCLLLCFLRAAASTDPGAVGAESCTALSTTAHQEGDDLSLMQRSLQVRKLGGAAGLELRPAAAAPKQQAHGMKGPAVLTAVVDLDLPPEERWSAFYRANRAAVLATLGSQEEIDAEMHHGPGNITAFLESTRLDPQDELLRELRGIAAALNDSRVTEASLLWGELGYERGVTGMCTGVLAAAADGTVFHGRNLDLGGALGYQRQLIDVTFLKNGTPFMLSTHLFFMVGIHTGFRIGKFSVEQNTRRGCSDVEGNLAAARRGGQPFTLFVRRVLEEAPSFKAAVQTLAQAQLMAKQYFTVAGPGPFEGALITRDRAGVAEPYGNVATLDPKIGRWYLVQTNDDIWRPPMDLRRNAALEKLASIAPQDMSAEAMLSVMTTLPVLNPNTVFTWVLEPSTGTRRLFLGGDELDFVVHGQGPLEPAKLV